MPLPREAIAEFAELYKRQYGTGIDEAEATMRARNLLAFYAAVLQCDSENNGTRWYDRSV
jgi:hypothetical protein